MRSIYDAVKTAVSVRPIASAAATNNGNAVNTQGYNTAMAEIEVGAATGGPTSYTIDAKVQDSADGSTGWADVTGAAITQIVASNKSAQIRVDGLGKNVRQYIRIVITVTITGGASPTIPVVGGFELARAFTEPVNNSSVGY